MATIGVLALQGDFREHREMLEGMGVLSGDVRTSRELDGVQGLIIPGGESTTIVKLLRTSGLLEVLQRRAREGFPIWGTCAGMILLANRLDEAGLPTLQAMDITVRRNAFGRQVDSFETDLAIPILGNDPFHAVFIRAPIIEAVGPGVEVLARLPDGRPVAARQGPLLATAFHPELTRDPRLHRFFVERIVGQSQGSCLTCGTPIERRAHKGPREAARRPTVLCIDDDPLVLHFDRTFLEGRRYRILVAEDGLSGIEIAKQERPDVILLDVMLRGLSGFDICRKLREEHALADTPIVFLTVFDSPNLSAIARAAGATGILHKPADAEVIVGVIEQVLHGKIIPPPRESCSEP